MSADIAARARKMGNPLVDGENATFVWPGERPPVLIADFTDWESRPQSLEQHAPGVWALTKALPRDAYIEYAFVDPESGERLVDALNPHTIDNGMGKLNNYFYMPAGQPTPLTRSSPEVPAGSLSQHQVANPFLIVGEKRRVDLYRPPVAGPVPLLVVYDGQDYRERARLPQVVDNLIAQGRIRPLALALVSNAEQARGVEYACSEATLGMLLTGVLPLAQKELDLLDPQQSPAAYGILGASMGGLMALYTGLRLPHIFGRVFSQSGAFELDQYEMVTGALVRYGPSLPLNIWMDVGQFEWLLEPNRRMHCLLQERAYQVAYREYPGGHNYTCWRNELALGLEYLFGAPA
ncbi:MAG: hypothetical protein JW862_14025 [Anaerolineales bacterium]|nr:hypothetical protein [Anaerolineales bacterium]